MSEDLEDFIGKPMFCQLDFKQTDNFYRVEKMLHNLKVLVSVSFRIDPKVTAIPRVVTVKEVQIVYRLFQVNCYLLN